MSTLLIALIAVTTPSVQDSPIPENLCEYLAYELQQGVEFDLITAKEAHDVYIRCLVNYSWNVPLVMKAGSVPDLRYCIHY